MFLFLKEEKMQTDIGHCRLDPEVDSEKET